MMHSLVKTLGLWLAMFAALAAAVAAGLQFGFFEVPYTDLVERYQRADSRFADIDGVAVHYVDQGSGDPVVLLHASYLSLRSWDDLADRLARSHRVIRLDLSGSGLTGYDPSERYGIPRNMEFVLGLMNRLDIQRATLVGTSSGGIAAFRLAAQNPERVDRLILINSAGMPRTAATNPLRTADSYLQRWIRKRVLTRDFWSDSLRDNFVAPHTPSDDFIQMTYDMNRREGWRDIAQIYVSNFETGDPERTLAEVRAPTLILWGKENRTLMHLEADVFAHWMTNAPTYVKKLTGVGHYPYMEEPDVVYGEIADFLAGTLDPLLTSPCATGMPAPASRQAAR